MGTGQKKHDANCRTREETEGSPEVAPHPPTAPGEPTTPIEPMPGPDERMRDYKVLSQIKHCVNSY